MGCSLSSQSLRRSLDIKDELEPLDDIHRHGARLELWTMAAFSSAATAWIFRDEDMLEKVKHKAVCILCGLCGLCEWRVIANCGGGFVI